MGQEEGGGEGQGKEEAAMTKQEKGARAVAKGREGREGKGGENLLQDGASRRTNNTIR